VHQAVAVADVQLRPPVLAVVRRTDLAAQHLASSEGISKDEATERLITAFRNIESAWTQMVMKRGLQAMLD
jgi:hypothetical protein